MTHQLDGKTPSNQALNDAKASIVTPEPAQQDHIDEKRDIAHVEEHGEPDLKARDVVYDAQEDDTKPRVGLRRLLKRNPSVEFVREVAEMDQFELDPTEVKRVEKKLMWLIVPALCVDYIFYYVDKTTLSYAAIFGIKEDLKLEKTQYSTLSSIFYVGWLVWALPGNLLMPKFPLAKYLAVNIFLWGAFLMGQGGAQNFETMVALRVVSGAAEAVAKPGFMAITSMFFTRVQQPIIMGTWYASQGVGIGLGGLIGYGIGQIKATLPPWRFEFLIIGAACSAWAILMGFLIPDSPYTSRWFTRREKVVIVSRKRADYHGIEKRQLKWDQVWECVKDVRTYLFFLLGLTANIPNGGTSNFGTLMTKGFGFDTLQTTLLQIPYGASQTLFIAVTIYANHKLSKYNVRTYVMSFVATFPVFGFAMMAYGKNQATKLIGYYFTGSSNAVFSLALSLVAANTGGTTKKMLASAVIFVGVAVGNIIGPYAFLEREAPRYLTGIIVCMISRIAEIVVILLLRIAFARPNASRDKKFANGDAEYDPDVVVYEDLSDKQNKHFRYLV